MQNHSAPPRDEHAALSSSSPRDRYFRYTRPEILALVPTSATRVLDVGCGAGTLGRSVKDRQPAEVHGVELAEDAATVAASHLDRVWNSTIEDALPHIEQNYYDCIVAADVLEHLVDPWAVLRQLKTRLKANGILVASIPNVRHWSVVGGLLEGRWEYQQEGLLDRTHLRFFTRPSVEQLFWQANLRIIDIGRTIRPGKLPKNLSEAIRRTGLRTDSLAQEADVFQFLVRAERADLGESYPHISVIVLNWNGKEDTLECLESISRIEYPSFDTIVVDNGSTDDSVAAIRARFPAVLLNETGTNLGYAGGNNVGMKMAAARGADYVLVLNNDTVVDPHVLRELVMAANTCPDAGILGAKTYYYAERDKVWYGEKFDLIGEDEYVFGAAMMIRSDLITQLGGFDERFFLVHEETDFCFRVRNSGFRCLVVPRARVWHKVSGSIKSNALYAYFYVRNRFLLSEKHPDRYSRKDVWTEIGKMFLPVFSIAGYKDVPTAKKIYWGVAAYIGAIASRVRQPYYRAQLMGIKDYFLRRFGNASADVWAFRNSSETGKTQKHN